MMMGMHDIKEMRKNALGNGPSKVALYILETGKTMIKKKRNPLFPTTKKMRFHYHEYNGLMVNGTMASIRQSTDAT